MAVKINIHNRSYDSSREKINQWKIPKKEINKFSEFLDELALGRVNKGKKISESRLCKYISMMKMPLEYWNKELEKIKLDDIKKFEKDLTAGKIERSIGGEYSDNSKVDTKKGIKIYFKWRLGGKSLDLVGWLDTRPPVKTPDFLKEEEIELLYRSCRNARERYLIAVIFDSGARAEEFLNIRYEDIFIPDNATNFVKLALKEEYSKTKGRTISLYWKHSLEAVRDYLRERRQDGIKSTEQVFNGSYDQARLFLRRLGLKILKKPLHFHLFRHSSATYYASRLNRQQLCIRYGWAFSSDMPDVYISRAGMDDKDLDDKFSGTEITKMKDELEKEKQKGSMELENMKKETELMKKEFEKELARRKSYDLLLDKIVKNNPQLMEVVGK